MLSSLCHEPQFSSVHTQPLQLADLNHLLCLPHYLHTTGESDQLIAGCGPRGRRGKERHDRQELGIRTR